MSCHCPNHLSLSMGSRGVVAGANPSLSQGEGRVLPGQVASSSQGLTDEQCGVQYLAQGHFDMQLSTARSQDLNQ